MHLTSFKIAAAVLTIGFTASADRILLTSYDYGPSAYDDMKTNLQASGHTVDIVNATMGGAIATSLGSTAYDQVFLYDLTASAYISGGDLDALASFFISHKNLVVDTRSYGYYYQGNNPSEVALLQNIAGAFDVRGGGIWVGTDHDPQWTMNANQFLTKIGINTVTGIHGEAVNDNDPASILLSGVVTTDLWAAGQTVGTAPLGIQPNGLDMRFHFGHSSPASGAIPYITASFGDYVAPDEPPDNHGKVPEPASMLFLGLGLVGLIARQGFRRK